MTMSTGCSEAVITRVSCLPITFVRVRTETSWVDFLVTAELPLDFIAEALGRYASFGKVSERLNTFGFL